MKTLYQSLDLEQLDADCLVVPYPVEVKDAPEAYEDLFQRLDKASHQFFTQRREAGDLPEKEGQTALFCGVPGIGPRVLFVGGNPSKASINKQATAAYKALAALALRRIATALHWVGDLEQSLRAFGYADYRFDAFRAQTLPKARPELEITAVFADEQQSVAFKEGAQKAQAYLSGMQLIRDLSNTPANVCYPAWLAKQALKLEGSSDLISVEVLKEKKLRELGMNALLAVAQGSHRSPRLIVVTYKNPDCKQQKPIVLVGKGVTFDSGGISLKPAAAMDEMKYDMCGAATVLGAIKAAQEAELPLWIVGIVAAVENMPGGGATKPGDIVTSMSGQTIEILNTDAEGRLILCDALTYAKRFDPECVIDMATLTGACIVALGSHRAAVLGNDETLVENLRLAGDEALDPVWPLPLDPEYRRLLDSPFADLQNIGGREAGTITASAFLSAFTEDYRWAHLDIAGVAWKQGKEKGATARPLALLLEFFKRQAH